MRLFSHDTKVDALARCTFFQGLSRSELAAVAKVTEDLEVGEGKALTREGEIGREFFVIVDGEVSITRDGSELRRLQDGDFFGEIALVEDRPRTATATATSRLRFFVLTRQAFRSLIHRQPGIDAKVRDAIRDRLATDDAV